MTDVLKATYSDLKTVKSRSVCQLILELPIEAMTDVVGLLGAPVPGNEVWVAVARLMTETEPHRGLDALESPLRKPAKLAQIAGILCNEGAFQKWSGNASTEEAAEWLRGHCNISSRAELDANEDAAAIFLSIKHDYEFWMKFPDTPSYPEHQKQARAAA